VRSLHWKLTLSYTVITVATLVTLLLMGVVATFEVVASRLPDLLLQSLGQRAPQAAPYLAADPADAAGASAWLRRLSSTLAEDQLLQTPHVAFDVSSTGGVNALLDRHGNVIASSGGSLPPAALPVVRAALAGDARSWRLTVRLSDGSIAGAWPVRDQNRTIVGVLASEVRGIDQPTLLGESVLLTTVLAVPVAPLAAIVGTLFGLLVARGFTRRYRRVAEAVRHWSQGDLATRVPDRSRDELAEVTGQLNRMAARLHDLLEAQRQLAVYEERQRMARDLHDSVKQQVFAISTLVSSSRDLLPAGADRASACLADLDSLIVDLQREIGALVQALRPPALDGQRLDEALGQLAGRWSARTGVATDLLLDPVAGCPPVVDEALFRIGQEALANVARHSGARHVRITLSGLSDAVTLVVTDDGVGLPGEAETSGLGLRSMQERMRAVGGTLVIEGSEDAGTTVTARWSGGGNGEWRR
jgi:NarL family two-component system sensor histidine kinase LiaS